MLSKEVSSTIFKVFGMTRSGIEPSLLEHWHALYPLCQCLHFTLEAYLIFRVLSKEVSSTIFKVFGTTPSGIEPRSSGTLARTLPTVPMSSLYPRSVPYISEC